jgi:predicted metal-dependent hydrolase
MQITLLNKPFDYHINHSKSRQNISLKLISSSSLLVTVPARLTKKIVEQLLIEKSAWIIKHAEQLKAEEQNPVNRVIRNGATVLYGGKQYQLQFHGHADSHKVTVKDASIHLYFTDPNPIRPTTLLRQFFIESARLTFQKLTDYWAVRMNVKPVKIAIREQKTRWGSCSSKGTISYNWQVIMAPPEILEYLIIHELSHLMAPNHSRHFWQIVETFDADYKKHRLWLKEKGNLLTRLFET